MREVPIPESAGQQMLMFRVADSLKRALKAHGLKQRDIARLLGISEPAVSDRLSGNRNLTLVSIHELAELAELRVIVDFRPPVIDEDVRELRKWLNEEPNRPLDRAALARLLAAHAA